jgi:hypothetical protein
VDGKTVRTCEVYNRQVIMTDTDNTKRKRAEDTAVGAPSRIGGANRESLVLMSEDRGLPEASLDDGSTAELGGLNRAIRNVPW